MLKAVIWDIDGTLVDSEPTHQQALLTVCNHYNVDISDLPHDHFLGVNLYGVWQALQARFPAGLAMETWIDELNAAYLQNASGLVMIPGAASVIHQLAQAGLRQAAVSNSNRVVVDANLALLGVGAVMEFSLSLDDVSEGKPSPVPYLAALNRMGLHPREAIAVEDSNTGLRSARAAGLQVIGYGHHLQDAHHSVSQLTDILDHILVG